MRHFGLTLDFGLCISFDLKPCLSEKMKLLVVFCCRVRVSDDQTYFATCSNDGTVKMWECSRLDGRSATNRSRYTYNKQGGQIKTMTFCDSAQSIAAASDSGAIHVFKSVLLVYM